jgi:hypothetical protein
MHETHMRSRRALVTALGTILGAAGCALVLSGVGVARVATTSPGKHVNTVVLITNKGIAVGESGRLPRGVVVTFFVKNLTKSRKNFEFLGHTTKPIPPGKETKLTLVLQRRGVYPYLSTLNPSKLLRGLFIVY